MLWSSGFHVVSNQRSSFYPWIQLVPGWLTICGDVNHLYI